MNNKPSGHVLLDEQVVSYDDEKLHLTGFRSIDLEPQDRLLLDCLVRGESELSVLGEQLAQLGLGGDAEAHAARVKETAQQPGSRLRWMEPIETIDPEVIVLDFSRFRLAWDTKPFVTRLRESRRVLHLGLDDHIIGSEQEACSMERHKDQFLGSLFRFVQWARSVVRFHQDAVIVFTGPQDPVFFGDLARGRPSITALEPGWPGRLGLQNLTLDVPGAVDPAPWLRELLYALRMNPADHSNVIERSTGSAFAALELFALCHADVLLTTCADHDAGLTHLGADRAMRQPLGVEPKVGGSKREMPEGIVVIADPEGEVASLEPLFQQLAGLLSIDAVSHVGIYNHGVMHRLELKENMIGVEPWSAPPPAPAEFGVALAVPGMMRHVTPMLDLMSEGVPVLFVPAEDTGPLGEHIPEQAWVRDFSVAALEKRLERVRDPASNERRDLTESCHHLLNHLDPVTVVESLLTTAPPEEEAFSAAP